MRTHFVIGIAISMSGVIGCGRDSVAVRGTVTLNGASLSDGQITFVPENGVGAAVGAPIKDGEYQLTGLAPGTYRVQINVIRQVEIPKDDPIYGRNQQGSVPTGELLPPDALGGKHVVTVSAGSQTIDFDAKMKQK